MADPMSAGGDRLWYTNQFIGVFQGREISMNSAGAASASSGVKDKETHLLSDLQCKKTARMTLRQD